MSCSYEYEGLMLTITTPAGICVMQDEEASEIFDQLEAIQTDEELEKALMAYEHVCE